MLDVTLLPAFEDNYIFIARDPATGTTAVVDPGEAAPVLAWLDQEGGGRLDLILLTHHHADHVGGTEAVRSRTGARVVGHGADRHRLPALDQVVGDGDTLAIGDVQGQVIATPGHTSGHVSYFFDDPADPTLFCGDTLFVMGCGRLFEGSAAQMAASLERLGRLPPATRVFCAHEYSRGNASFAMHLDGDNPAVQDAAERIAAARAAGQPTVPSRLHLELAANPFLRAEALRGTLGMANAPLSEVFAEIRHRKDGFRG